MDEQYIGLRLLGKFCGTRSRKFNEINGQFATLIPESAPKALIYMYGYTGL
jgi:hypothetical protein